jgi:hypothetical protein
MLRLRTAQEERSASNQRRIQAMLSLCILAVNVEAKIANFLARPPFQYHAAARYRARLEGRYLHCRGRLNRRKRGRDIV